MSNRDFKFILIVGGAVGLLIQPILANTVTNIDLSIGIRAVIFVFFLAFAPFALWIASLVSRAAQRLSGIYQFAQFAAVGTLNTFIDVGVLNIETFLYGTPLIGAALFAAFKAVSFLCSTTNSFFWNKYWTFGSAEKPHARQVTSFYAIAAIGWALNVGMATLVKVLGGGGDVSHARIWTNIVAPLAGVAASFLWDFFGYKFWVFKK